MIIKRKLIIMNNIYIYILILLLINNIIIQAVDRNKFRTCSQTAFCKHFRSNGEVDNNNINRYQLLRNGLSINEDNSEINGFLKDTYWPLQDPLAIHMKLIKNGIIRIKIKESSDDIYKRWEVRDVLEKGSLDASPAGILLDNDKNMISITFGDRNEFEWHVNVEPLSFIGELFIDSKSALKINSNGLLRYQQYRSEKNPKPQITATAENENNNEVKEDPLNMKFPYDKDGDWEEQFGSHKDIKQHGPSAVALDIEFSNSQHLYGIPEHASSLNLKDTIGNNAKYSDPYRLFNLDVFEYELDNPMALYGAIPYLMSLNKDHSVGMFWLNSAETFIDIFTQQNQRTSHWISESGIIDLFIFPGPNPLNVLKQYGSLTGYTSLPQQFAIAYHQCRWNYKSEEDVANVDKGFDEHNIPYDVIWLDIEHTDGKKYFTWDQTHFPTPKDMQNKIASKGRKMVTIVDPHIKRDNNYYVHKEAENKGLYIKKPKGENGDYEGWCWPGSVSYLDFLRPEVRQFWAELFSLNRYQGSTQNLYTWNDMNEPSVFNGPEVTMQKNNLHLGNEEIEHRDVHNVYGFYVQMSTSLGHIARDNARPFVLTRSFFAGSQKYGPMWTGDNMAKWDHLEAAQPMLLTQGIAGYAFSGADVGGFFGDPEPELLVRWYQAGAFQPFFRAHAHIDAKRREPWLFGEPYTTQIREAIRSRYRLLPYLYTLFFEASRHGTPIMRPLFLHYYNDPNTYDIENQFLLGRDLLVKPVVTPGQISTDIYLPNEDAWVEIHTEHVYTGSSKYHIPAPADYIPVLQRSGSIVPRKERPRRSSKLMIHDPYTLIIVVDKNDQAYGSLYIDDGHTFKYQNGEYQYRSFELKDSRIVSRLVEKTANPYRTNCVIERIVIKNMSKSISSAILKYVDNDNQSEIEVQTNNHGHIVLRKPSANIDVDWDIILQ